MKAYTYYKGEFKELEIDNLNQLGGFTCHVKAHTQVYILCSNWEVYFKWYLMNDKNRLVAVTIDACSELRTALLLQGIPCQ